MNSRLAHEQERLKLALSAADASAWEWSPASDSTTPVLESESLRRLRHIVFQKEWPGDVHPEDQATFNRVLLEEIKQPASFELEYRVVGAEKRWLRTKGQAVTASPGTSPSLVGVTFDITREKQSVEALRRSEKLATMGQLSATIAHEINNPLESIMGLMHLAKATSGVPAQALEYLDLALVESERVAEIARSTLGFCREEKRAENVRVDDALKVILNLYRKKALKKQVQVVTRWGKDLVFSGFAGELKEIVSNLLSNAVEATCPGGKVVVRVRQWAYHNRSGLLVTVADNGPGIIMVNRQKLFEPFFTTKEEIGTGLGLWITQEFVARAGGHIRLKTNVAGGHRGTTFRVFLPAALHATGPVVAPLKLASTPNLEQGRLNAL